jgi:Flp pilus assembly protein TadG
LFFLFIFGMIEYGRLIMVQQLLTNAAREGVRVAILDNRTATDATNAANQYLGGANIQGATISVTPDPPTSAASGNPVSVTISVPFKQVSWLPSPMFLGTATMTATATMRRETMP